MNTVHKKTSSIKIDKSGFIICKDYQLLFKEETSSPCNNNFITFIDINKDTFIKRFNQQKDGDLKNGFWLPLSNYIISSQKSVPQGYKLRVGDILRFGMDLYKVREQNSFFAPKNTLNSFGIGNLRSPNNTMHNVSVNCNFSFPNHQRCNTNNSIGGGSGVVVTYQNNNPLGNITNSSINLSNGNLMQQQDISKSSLTFKQLFHTGNTSIESLPRFSHFETFGKQSHDFKNSFIFNKSKKNAKEKKNSRKRVVFDNCDVNMSTIHPLQPFSQNNNNYSNIINFNDSISISSPKKYCFSNTLKDMDGDIEETHCKICHLSDNSSFNPLICPCNCISKIRYIHVECLKKWYITRMKKAVFEHLSIVNIPKYKCELCHFVFPEIIKIRNLLLTIIDFIRPGSFHYVILEKIHWEEPKHEEDDTVFYILDMKKSKQITVGNDPNCDVTLCKEQSKTGVIEFVECNFYFRDLSSGAAQNFVFIQGDIMLLPKLPITIQNNYVTLTFLMKLKYIKKLFCYHNKKLAKLTYHDSFSYQKMFLQRMDVTNIKNVDVAKAIVNPDIFMKKRTTDGAMNQYDKFKDEIIILNSDNCFTRDSEAKQIVRGTRTMYSSNDIFYHQIDRDDFQKKKNIHSSVNLMKVRGRVKTFDTPKQRQSLFKRKGN